MHYKNLFRMAAVSFVSMFILMYVMVDVFANVYINLNNFYMAGVMTMPMIIIELLIMRSMYTDRRFNFAVIIISLITFAFLVAAIRRQDGICDKQFLKSMIPHHASALLMCEQASIKDPEIKQLCKNIRASQQAEIDFMKRKLKENLNVRYTHY